MSSLVPASFQPNLRRWRYDLDHNTAHFLNGHFRILNWRYLPYIRPIVQAYVREYPPKIWPYMVLTYLHFRILEFPLIFSRNWWQIHWGIPAGFRCHMISSKKICKFRSRSLSEHPSNFWTPREAIARLAVWRAFWGIGKQLWPKIPKMPSWKLDNSMKTKLD